MAVMKIRCETCRIEKEESRFVMKNVGNGGVKSRYCDDCRKAYGESKRSEAHKAVRAIANQAYNGEVLASLEEAKKVINRSSCLAEQLSDMCEGLRRMNEELESLCPWVDEIIRLERLRCEEER